MQAKRVGHKQTSAVLCVSFRGVSSLHWKRKLSFFFFSRTGGNGITSRNVNILRGQELVLSRVSRALPCVRSVSQLALLHTVPINSRFRRSVRLLHANAVGVMRVKYPYLSRPYLRYLYAGTVFLFFVFWSPRRPPSRRFLPVGICWYLVSSIVSGTEVIPNCFLKICTDRNPGIFNGRRTVVCVVTWLASYQTVRRHAIGIN